VIECYTFERYNKPALTLTPFLKEGCDLSGEAVVLYASGMLNSQQKDQATYSLFSQIDFAVDRWIQDKRYIPRLLISALVFMMSYLFFSLVVRDPIPMIDELLISTALTIGVWITLARRDTRSLLAQENRQRLKMIAAKRSEEINEKLFAIEAYLDSMAKSKASELAQQIASNSVEPLITKLSEQERVNLLQLLERYGAIYEKSTIKWVSILERSGSKKDLSSKLYIQSSHGSVDLSFLALYTALKQSGD